MGPKDIRHRFAYHPPKDDATITAHQRVRAACEEAADEINELCPDGREKSTAVTKLEEAMMWANAAIARAGGPQRPAGS